MVNKKRAADTIRKLKEDGISQILICDPAAIFYYTGKLFSPGERFLALFLSEEGDNILFLNPLFSCQEDLGVKKVWIPDGEDVTNIVSRYICHDKILGVDKNLPARFLLPLIKQGIGTEFVNASYAVDRQRAVKDRAEQKAMIISSEINDRAMAEFQKLIRAGVTEQEIAKQMPDIYKKCGAYKISFAIVAFGKNAADPHHSPDNTRLQEGDCVLFDVGAVKNGYCSDMTRTFFFRTADEKKKKVYEIVRRANEAAEAAVKPGMRFCEIDKIARDMISGAGYGEYFTHRLGHSIGLQVHEYGDVSAQNTDRIQAGMTFSIEPGIYLPGEFGVRIEDLVLVTDDGCRVLNQYEKGLVIVDDGQAYI